MVSRSWFPHSLFHRLVRPDAKKFALRNLIWDPMISASLEACQGILNCPIMTVMGSPLKSTMGLGNLKPRTTRSLLLPSLSFHRQQRESIFMQEHCSLFASCSSMSYTGPYIYDKSLIYFFICVKYIPFHYPFPVMKATVWNNLHFQSNMLHLDAMRLYWTYGIWNLNESMTLQCLCSDQHCI